jgi:hypothetical protein
LVSVPNWFPIKHRFIGCQKFLDEGSNYCGRKSTEMTLDILTQEVPKGSPDIWWKIYTVGN